MAPQRIHRERRKGWHMPPNTVSVCRPSRWGNIYVINGIHPETGEKVSRERAIELYAEWVQPHANIIREELAGKNLACWCRLDQVCHATVLLEIANAPALSPEPQKDAG